MALQVFLKVLLKSILILLTAGMIAAGFYFLVTRSQTIPALQGDNLIRGDQRLRLYTPDGPPTRSPLFGRAEREFGERGLEGRQGRNGSLIAWLEIARNLGLIALITFFVIGIQWALKRMRHRPSQ